MRRRRQKGDELYLNLLMCLCVIYARVRRVCGGESNNAGRRQRIWGFVVLYDDCHANGERERRERTFEKKKKKRW